MSEASWQRVRRIFEQALDLDAPARGRFLDEQTAADPEIREEVEGLLRLEERADSFLQPPSRDQLDNVFSDHADPLSEGTTLGSWRALKEIGRGGMGVVYLAERADQQFEKAVAVKVIKRGMDSAEVLRRFANERQVLAHLEHPYIARLLDGGQTADGLPYLVMEYVQGRPIDQYVREQALSCFERLRLFTQVCEAVACAHRSLIVHRDLKPSNILVTDEGLPKLLDFGISKVLDHDSPEGSQLTLGSSRPLTPDYASPEQVRCEPITTASDVYSLGVVLFELLSGRRPFDFSGLTLHQMEQIICSRPPGQLSDGQPGEGAIQRHLLRGDLDNIVALALKKDPEERYVSVDALATDLRCHLTGLPVSARPDSLRYRAGKFIRRNRLLVSGIALVMLVLSAATLISTLQYQSAEAARAQAEQQSALADRRFRQVRGLAHDLMFEIYAAIERLSGSTGARKLVVDTSMNYLSALAEDAGDNPELLLELSAGYRRMGDVTGKSTAASLGDQKSAGENYTRALELARKLLADDPANPDLSRELADVLVAWANHQFHGGRIEPAIDAYLAALDRTRDLPGQSATGGPHRRLLGQLNYLLARAEQARGRSQAAGEYLEQARAIAQELHHNDPQNAELERDLILVLQLSGQFLEAQNQLVAAALEFEQIVERTAVLSQRSPENNQRLRGQALALGHLGRVTLNAGRIDEARQHFQRQADLIRSLTVRDPLDVVARDDLADAQAMLARTDWYSGRAEDAEEGLRQVLDSAAVRAAGEPGSIELSVREAEFRLDLVGVLRTLGRLEEALEELETVSRSLEPRLVETPLHLRLGRRVCLKNCLKGELLLDRAEPGAALPILQGFRDRILIQVEREPDNAWSQRMVMVSANDLGMAYQALGAVETESDTQRREHLNRAREWYETSLRKFDELTARGFLSSVDATSRRLVEQEFPRIEASLKALDPRDDR